jgi:transposase
VEQIATVGIDLAKSVFSLHGVDAAGKTVLRRTVRRVQRLHEEFVKALRNPALLERYSKMGLEATPSASPEAFFSFIEAEIRRCKPIVAAAGAKVDN